MLCDYCDDINNSLYHVINVVCANLEKVINDMAEKLTEIMKERMLQCVNRIRKHNNVHKLNSSFGLLRHEAGSVDDFGLYYLT